MVHFRPKLVRFTLLVMILLLVSASGYAQTSENYCEPSPALKEELRNADKLGDEGLPYKLSHERRTVMWQDLLKKYPHDFHLQRRYQDERRNGLFYDRDALLTEYRAQ